MKQIPAHSTNSDTSVPAATTGTSIRAAATPSTAGPTAVKEPEPATTMDSDVGVSSTADNTDTMTFPATLGKQSFSTTSLTTELHTDNAVYMPNYTFVSIRLFTPPVQPDKYHLKYFIITIAVLSSLLFLALICVIFLCVWLKKKKSYLSYIQSYSSDLPSSALLNEIEMTSASLIRNGSEETYLEPSPSGIAVDEPVYSEAF